MAVRPPNKLLWFAYYWLPVLILAGFIFSVSSVPGKDIPSIFPYEDILYHGAIYVILAVFYLRAIRNTGCGRNILKLALFTVLFGVLFGAGDELHQLLTPGRSCSFFDLIIDTAGSGVGAAAAGAYYTWRS